jgi:threonylcarbamoyladenosine tRNA methylthiotransferase MtaB
MTSDQIITYGCRLNAVESQIISDHINTLGNEKVVVVHTCSVTRNAEKECIDKVKSLIKDNANLSEDKKKIVFVTGCSAQLNPDQYLNLGVDRVIGNADKLAKESYVIKSSEDNKKIWSEMSEKRSIDDLPQTARLEGKTRAFVQIQNGCDHDCTFCVIYKARGKNRSVSVQDIVDQVKIFVQNGYQEIVLTGVDITDYGKDFDNGINLAKLVKKILALVPEISRLRFSSIDVAEIDQELLELIIYEQRVMPYFHMSMQAGSDLILKRMKRRHLRNDIKNFYYSVLERRPDSVFGADIIAGFPTETEELFSETADLVKELDHLIHLHVFPFSTHPGTPAARMPQVKKEFIKERAQILRTIGQENLLKFANKRVGCDEEVLFESNGFGRTKHFLKSKLILNDLDEHEKSIRNAIVGQIVKKQVKSIFTGYSLNKDGLSCERFSHLVLKS